jgi:hypothetical protein
MKTAEIFPVDLAGKEGTLWDVVIARTTPDDLNGDLQRETHHANPSTLCDGFKHLGRRDSVLRDKGITPRACWAGHGLTAFQQTNPVGTSDCLVGFHLL